MNRKLRIAVDLLPLRQGGQNGGAKWVIIEFLTWIQNNARVDTQLIYLCSSLTQHEVRNFCRETDLTICIKMLDGVAPLSPELLTENDHDRVECDSGVFEEFPVDLIYAPFGNTALRFPGVPLVIMIHDLLHKDYPASLPNEEIVHRDAFFKEMLEIADQVQVNSNYTKERLNFHYKYPLDKIFVTHLPIHNRLSSEKNTERSPLDADYFFYPANFWPHKNHLALLVSYHNYINRCSDKPWKLVLTGHQSKEKEYAQEIVAALGIANHVVFLEYVSQEMLETYWFYAGALVFPSLHEGFGIPILEAMHYNVPVICHEGTALKEVGGNACRFCDCRKPLKLAEELLKVSSDPALREDFVKRGRSQLNNFDIEIIMNRLLDKLLESIESDNIPLSSKGIYSDGWIENKCLSNLPKKLGRTEIAIELFSFPEDRYISIFLDEYSFGSYDLKVGAPNKISFFANIEGQNLRIESSDTSKLSDEDPRSLGVRIESINLSPDNAEPIWIWKQQ